MLLTRLAAACALAVATAIAPACAQMHVVHQGREAPLDRRLDYEWAVLNAALEKTRAAFGDYTFNEAKTTMSSARMLSELLDPTGRINVLARATSTELETKLLPVRIPVDRGLLGYRILLVRQDNVAQFVGVSDLAGLGAFRFGQGKGWIDAPVLAASGLNLQLSTTYEGLFSMLAARRFDAFPRAVDEAFREFDTYSDSIPALRVEPTLLLYYPMPRYFFMRRDREGKLLAKRIETGLELMIADGSLQRLFKQHKGALIERAQLRGRRVLRIPNPLLPAETPLERQELWYDPARD
jgi:hypothetical protein